MEILKYIPNFPIRTEFDEFRKLKTTEEKEAFKNKMKAEFDKKTPEEKQAYHDENKVGLLAIKNRVDELIKQVELENEAKIMSMA